MDREYLTKAVEAVKREGLKKVYYFIVRKCFRFFEKYFGLHIVPAHYYSPIPVTRELEEDVYSKVFECEGIDWNIDEQLEYLEKIFPLFMDEYKPAVNYGLSVVDAFVLYAMIRQRKPDVMIEIGSGDSTMISLKALEMNREQGFPYTFHAIEPYPRDELKHVNNGSFRLIEKKLQDVEIDLLQSADILFIDSSHVSKIGSDVNYEILEIIPKLKSGAIVHWHDIVIPTNYWKEWIHDGNKFWNESYMVHAFMMFNDSFKTIWAARYMQLNHFSRLREHFDYLKSNHHLMSFWIQKVK